jgi:hypothetical protein
LKREYEAIKPLDLEAFPTRSRQIWRLLRMFSDVVNTFSQTLPPTPKFTIFMGGVGTISSHEIPEILQDGALFFVM